VEEVEILERGGREIAGSGWMVPHFLGLSDGFAGKS